MNYLDTYQKMINNTYIENKGMFELEINTLSRELSESTTINDVLIKMTDIEIYKRALKTNFRISGVKSSDGTKVYKLATGHLGKNRSGKRVWLSCYIGNRDHDHVTELRNFRNKAVEKLKEINL